MPDLATAPISDDEAVDLLDQYDDASPQRQGYIGTALRQYQGQQAAIQTQETEAHFEKVYSDFDTMGGTWQNDGQTWDAEDKAAVANRQFMAFQSGKSLDEIRYSFPLMRDKYAADNFGKAKTTDKEFYDLVAGATKQKVDARKAVEEVPADIVTAGIEDLQAGKPMRSSVEIVNSWKQAHPEIPPAEGDESTMMHAANSYAQETSAFMQKYAPQVDAVFKTLAGFSGVEGSAPKKQGDVTDLADQLVSMPEDNRQKLYQMAALYAQKKVTSSTNATGGKTGEWAYQLGESVLRGTTGIAQAAQLGVKEAQLHDELDQLNGKVLPKFVAGPGYSPTDETPEPITDEQKTAKIAEVQKQLGGIQIARELFEVAKSNIDPIKAVSSGWLKPFEEGGYMVGGAVPLVAAALIPDAGAPLVGAAIASTEYNRIRLQYPDVPIGQAQGMAAASSAAQTIFFNLRASSISGALPTTAKFIESLAKPNPAATFWKSVFSKSSAMNVGEQATQQAGISFTPMIVDGLSKTLGADMPQYDWDKQLDALKDAAPATVASMIPFIILGVAGVGIGETKRGRALLNDPSSLARSSGIDIESAQKIAAEPDPKKQVSMYQDAFKEMTPDQVKTHVENVDASVKAKEAVVDPKAPTSFTSQDAAGETVFNIRDGEGNIIHSTTDGDAHVVAMASASEHYHDADQQQISMLISHFEQDNAAKGRGEGEQTFVQSGEKRTAQDEATQTSEGIDSLNERIRISALSDPGIATVPLSEIRIFGHNVSGVREGVFHDVSTLHEGATAATVIEERVHGETDRALSDGTVTIDSLREGVRSVEQATGERLMSDEATSQEVKEAVGSLGVAYMFGRVRDSRLPAGFRGFFRQLSAYFKEVFGRAGRLRKAIAKGKVKEDFHHFIANSVGLPLEAHIEATKRAELGKIVEGGKSFSMGRDQTETPEFKRWFGESKVIDAEGKPLVVYHGTDKNFTKFDLDRVSDGFWFSSNKEKISAGEAGAAGRANLIPVYLSIQKMAGWDEYERSSIGQLIRDGFDGVRLDDDYLVFNPTQIKSAIGNSGAFDPKNPDIAMSLGRAEYHKAINDAIEAENRDPKLRRERIANAKKKLGVIRGRLKEDEIGKQYDPTAAIDQLEQDRSAKIADLHAEEETAITNNRLDNRDDAGKQINAKATSEKEKAIEQDFASKRKAVEEKFKTESAKIEREAEVSTKAEDVKAKVNNERANLVQSMGELEAILTILPAEARAKVGGYPKLSKLTTQQARAKFLEDRIEKVSDALETYQKKDFTSQFDKILKKSMPTKGKAGAKKVGKIGDEAHQLFDVLREAKFWDADHAEAHAAVLEASIETGDLTPAQEAHAELEAQMVRLVGDWAHADSARMESAVENAAEILRKGYAEVRELKLKQRELNKARQEQAISNTGKAGTEPEVRTRAREQMGLKGWAMKSIYNLSSFEQIVNDVFGRGSVIGNRMAEAQGKADYQKEDGTQNKMAEVDSFFTKLAGGELKGLTLRHEMGSKFTISFDDPRYKGIEFTQLEGIDATLMWRRSQGRMHLIGKLDENGKPIADVSYDQSFIDHIESQLTPEAKKFREFLIDSYATEHAEINPLYKELYNINLPHDENYYPVSASPAQLKAGEIPDPLTGAAVSAKSNTPSSLRSLTSTASRPKFGDALQKYISHVKQLEHWKAYAKFSQEANSILNNDKVRRAIEASAGKEAADVVGKWTDYFAMGGFQDAGAQLHFNKLISHLVNGASTVLLVGKASVLAVQSVQLGAGLAEMKTSEYLPRFAKLMTGQLGWGDALNSAYIQRRIEQQPVLIRQAMEGLRAGTPNALKYNVAKLGKTISGADGLFTAGTYAIVLDHQREIAKELGLTGAEAETYAHDNAARITDRVAQPTRGGARSILENTMVSPSHRLLWAFASESRQKLALAAWGVAAKNKPSGERARALAVAWLVGGVGATVVRAMVADTLDPSDDDTFDDKHWNPKRLALASLTGPMQGIPILGDALNASLYGLAGVYQPEGNILDAKNAVSAARRLPKTLSGESDADQILKDADSILSALGMANENLAAAASISHLAKQLYGAGKNTKKIVDPESE